MRLQLFAMDEATQVWRQLEVTPVVPLRSLVREVKAELKQNAELQRELNINDASFLRLHKMNYHGEADNVLVDSAMMSQFCGSMSETMVKLGVVPRSSRELKNEMAQILLLIKTVDPETYEVGDVLDIAVPGNWSFESFRRQVRQWFAQEAKRSDGSVESHSLMEGVSVAKLSSKEATVFELWHIGYGILVMAY